MPYIEIGDLTAEVIQKDIKNIHLSVHPPVGRIRIAAPRRFDLDTIRVFAISKLGWIRDQQYKLQQQDREFPREFIYRESHYFKGQRYLLDVVEKEVSPRVELHHKTIRLHIRPGTSLEKRREVLETWYRTCIKEQMANLIPIWERRMGVKVNDFGVKKMRTKWGTCNPEARRIWLNLELAKKPVDCLEYIVVHEMVHLLERTHNEQFVHYMDRFLPNWRHKRDLLNSLPVQHLDWKY